VVVDKVANHRREVQAQPLTNHASGGPDPHTQSVPITTVLTRDFDLRYCRRKQVNNLTHCLLSFELFALLEVMLQVRMTQTNQKTARGRQIFFSNYFIKLKTAAFMTSKKS